MKHEDCCWCPYYSESKYRTRLVLDSIMKRDTFYESGDEEQTCSFSGHRVDIQRLRRCPQLHPFENNGV